MPRPQRHGILGRRRSPKAATSEGEALLTRQLASPDPALQILAEGAQGAQKSTGGTLTRDPGLEVHKSRGNGPSRPEGRISFCSSCGAPSGAPACRGCEATMNRIIGQTPWVIAAELQGKLLGHIRQQEIAEAAAAVKAKGRGQLQPSNEGSAPSYPKFVRQLSPTPGRVLDRNPVTGKWPAPAAPAAPAEIEAAADADYFALTGSRPARDRGLREWELRKAVYWREKRPSRTAYADWVGDSRPAYEEAWGEKAEREDVAAETEAAELAEAAE
jgi:hypothetical protein